MPYLVLAKHVFDDKVQFLVAESMNKARAQLPRYELEHASQGYMTLWKPRWATKDDVKKYRKEFKASNIEKYYNSNYEFKNENT